MYYKWLRVKGDAFILLSRLPSTVIPETLTINPSIDLMARGRRGLYG
ncbi:MAG: hypothetical protein IJ467_05990 [Bacteroidaceae bacterium]|nr:hypothetical protein [Bacteroidaceae bacterium]